MDKEGISKLEGSFEEIASMHQKSKKKNNKCNRETKRQGLCGRTSLQ